MTTLPSPVAPATPSPFALALRRFRKSRLGVIGGWLLAVLYLSALLGGFLAPYGITTQHQGFEYQPPQPMHVMFEGKVMRPFVYGSKTGRDPVTFAKTSVPDTTTPVPIEFFVRGEAYRFLGIPTTLHLFGVNPGPDNDRFYFPFRYRPIGPRSSVTYAGRRAGQPHGGRGGYHHQLCYRHRHGRAERLLRRAHRQSDSAAHRSAAEFSQRLPILLALSTLIPASWPSTYVYLGIVAVLALIGWASLARVVRGQVLSARQVEYVSAAQAVGASDLRVILRHIVPNLSSFLVITATLSLPGYILGESTLSFLGLGIKEPMTSWGLLLKDRGQFADGGFVSVAAIAGPVSVRGGAGLQFLR